MKCYMRNIEDITVKNEEFRPAIYMAKYCHAWRDQPED